MEYSEDNKPQKIKTIVISTQHDEFDKEEVMLSKIKNDIHSILIPRILKNIPIQSFLMRILNILLIQLENL